MNLETASLDIDTTIYPDSDGKPIADNTRQLQMIFKLYGNIRTIHEDMMDVFVAGDHLIYPIKKDNKTRIAPDVYVAYGRPDHHRGSYKVWMENNIFPQVVVEVLSPKNTRPMMEKKRAFYERFKCEEYIEIDPEDETLEVWVRPSGKRKLREVNVFPEWISPRMGVRFVQSSRGLEISTPSGRPFLTQTELEDERLEAVAHAQSETKRADAATAQADQYRAKLIELGIDPDTLNSPQL